MNDYFCVLPFFGYEYQVDNKSKHCCLLPDDYDIDVIKNDILNGRKSSACSACWDLEDAGLISDRKIKNSTLDHYWNKDINFIEEEVRQGNYSQKLVKFSASNTCNATCVTCGAEASSAWRELLEKSAKKKIDIIPVSPYGIPVYQGKKEKHEIDQNLDFKNLVGLNLLGGEPLYEKINFYILEQLIKNNNANCFIQITTNGSVTLSNEFKRLLSQFKNLNFGISIDGVGPVFEYMRYPLKWNKLLDNLKFFRTISDNISAGNTTSNLNVLYHQQTIDWFENEKIPYHFNPVIFPTWFRPGALPKDVKERILDKFGHSQNMSFFLSIKHTNKDDEDFQQALQQIKYQDQIKNISIRDYLPEFCDLINY